MGERVMWGGLTAIVAVGHFIPLAIPTGAVIMVLGYLIWLFKS